MNLANRYDLMIVSTKGVVGHRGAAADRHRLRRSRPAAVRAARFRRRRVPDPRHPAARHPALPVLKRRRGGRSRAPACRHRRASSESRPPRPRSARASCASSSPRTARRDAEIDILLNERVELNAMTSDALIAMIETQAQGLRAQKGGSGRRPARGDLSRLPPQSAAAGEVRGDGGGVRRRGRRNRDSEKA